MATQLVETVQYRLTQHYIEKLRQANAVLRYNRDNSDHWLQAIERDWAQIRNWQQWAFAHSQDHLQCAQLCATFGTIGDTFVSIRQTAPERLIWYQQALEGAQRSADSQKERDLLYLVGTTAYSSGNFEEAGRCGKRLLEIGRNPADHLALGYGWFITGNIHSYRTELERAEAAFRKALAHFEKSHADIMIGHAVQGIARIMIFRGQYPEALTYAKRYLEIIEAAGRESDFSLAYQTLSNIHTRLGNLTEAKSYAEKAVEISRRLGYMRMIPSSLLILGYAELALNELDAAWDHFQETIATSHVNASKFDFTAATYSLGDVRLRQNNLSEALTYYQEALSVASESRLAAYQSLCSTGIAYIYTLQHEFAAARSALRTAAETALDIKSDILLAKTLIPATKLWQETGYFETAAEWSGLLMVHPEHAEQDTVDAICTQLETEIGTARYLSLAARGKTLTLKQAVIDLLRQLQLTQPSNQ